MKIELCFHYPPRLNKSTSNIDDLAEKIGDELLKEGGPRITGVLQKTPRKVMIQQIIQMQLDALIDEIFNTDDKYMCNQRWKKEMNTVNQKVNQ